MFDAFRCAVRNLSRKKNRSFLTITGIAIGVASVVIISTIGEFGKTSVSDELESLGLGGVMVSTSLSDTEGMGEEELQTIQNTPEVEYAMPLTMYYSTATVRNQTLDSVILGIDSGASNIISMEILYGRPINQTDIDSNAKVCLVDQNLAQTGYYRDNIVGKKVYLCINGVNEAFTVVGITKTGSGMLQSMMGSYIPTFVYIPYSTYQNAAGLSNYQQIAVRLQESSDVDEASEKIVALLDQHKGYSGKYSAENLAKEKDGLNNLLNIVTLSLTAISGISLLVASLSVMTMMLVSVHERTIEIGIKKSIGASRSKIMMEFLIEAAVLSLAGCAVGTVLGMGAAYLAALSFEITIDFRYDVILFTIFFSLATGMIFGVYPAGKAAKLKPVDALRLE